MPKKAPVTNKKTQKKVAVTEKFWQRPEMVVIAVAVFGVLGAYLVLHSRAAPATWISPNVTQWPGSISIQEGAGPFVKDQTLHFNVSYGKTPQYKTPWVEVDCYSIGSTIAMPGFSGGSVPLWVGRDYDAPYAVLIGDAGGTSLWKNAGYPAVDCQAFLYFYYDVKGVEKVAYFGSTPVYRVNPQ